MPAVLAVLLVVSLLGCARLFWNNPAQDGGYIRLNVGNPGAKGIGVGEYEVTGLSIAVYDPQDQLLDSFEWDPGEGLQSYLVQVNSIGTYRLEVTHYSDDNGEPVEATETAEFEITAMVITVIDITPGVIGMIEVEGGPPPEPVDVRGYWNFFWTLEGEEVGPVLYHIEQTGDQLDSIMGFSGSVSGSNLVLEAYIDPGIGVLLYARLDGTVSESGDLITGMGSGDFGTGPFRMVRPSEAPFGHFDLSGEVEEVPVSLDTEFALASGGEFEVEYIYSVSLYTGWYSGELKFYTEHELTPGHYTVTEDDPHEEGQICAALLPDGSYDDETQATSGYVNVVFFDGISMTGDFNLEFEDGSTFSGDFYLLFDMYDPATYITGFWNGSPVAEYGLNSHRDHWATTNFNLTFVDHESDIQLWFTVDGAVEVGIPYTVPFEAWIGFRWLVEGEPSLDDVNLEVPGTLILSRYDSEGVAGVLDMGDTMTANFDVSFWEQWEPPDY